MKRNFFLPYCILLGLMIAGCGAKNDVTEEFEKNLHSYEKELEEEYSIKAEEIKKSDENYEKANSFYNAGEYFQAMNLYALVTPESDKYDKAQKLVSECYEKYVDVVMQTVNEAIDKKQYIEAMDYIDSEKDHLETNDYSKLMQMKEEISEKYINVVIEEAIEMAKSHNVDDINAGWNLINSAIQRCGETPKLSEAMKIVLEYAPDALSYDLIKEDYFNNYKSADRISDTSGNWYDYNFRYGTSSFYSEPSEILADTYALDKKYVRFTATLAPVCTWIDLPNEGGTYFFVWVDGREVVNTYMDKHSEPFYIDIDVTGVEYLKIGIQGGSFTMFLLADPYLYVRY